MDLEHLRAERIRLERDLAKVRQQIKLTKQKEREQRLVEHKRSKVEIRANVRARRLEAKRLREVEGLSFHQLAERLGGISEARARDIYRAAEWELRNDEWLRRHGAWEPANVRSRT